MNSEEVAIQIWEDEGGACRPISIEADIDINVCGSFEMLLMMLKEDSVGNTVTKEPSLQCPSKVFNSIPSGVTLRQTQPSVIASLRMEEHSRTQT